MNFYQTASPDRYNILKQAAREMRNRPTQAESVMWNFLCNNKLGVKFRRQHVIGDYIVDFVSLKTKLVIEIDGSIHNNAEQIVHDQVRTEFLTSKGYYVMRFKNEEVLCNSDQILKSIESWINEKI